MSLSDFRGGRGRGGFRGSRSRGGPPRGGGFRGGYSDRGDRGGFRGRGRGDGYSRGGPPRRMSRDDMSPPRKVPLLSKSYDSRRADHYDDEDDYNDRPIAPRSRDTYSSQLSRDRLNSRDKGYSTRGSRGRYPSARGDYSPVRESSSYRDSYNDRKESYRTSGREYLSPRSSDYRAERLPRESPREYASSRDYSQSSREFREPLRDDFRDLPPRDRYESDLSPRRSSYMDRGLRDDSPYREDTRREYSSRTFSSRMSDRPPRDYPPSREYRGRGAPRGSIRGGRDFYSNGRGSRGGPYRSRGGPPRGRGGPPRGRGGRPDYYPRDGGRRSLSPGGRGGILGKRRLSPDDGYRR